MNTATYKSSYELHVRLAHSPLYRRSNYSKRYALAEMVRLIHRSRYLSHQ